MSAPRDVLHNAGVGDLERAELAERGKPYGLTAAQVWAAGPMPLDEYAALASVAPDTSGGHSLEGTRAALNDVRERRAAAQRAAGG